MASSFPGTVPGHSHVADPSRLSAASFPGAADLPGQAPEEAAGPQAAAPPCAPPDLSGAGCLAGSSAFPSTTAPDGCEYVEKDEFSSSRDSSCDGEHSALPPPPPPQQQRPLPLEHSRLLRQLLSNDSFSEVPPPSAAGPQRDGPTSARRRQISAVDTSSFIFGDDTAHYEFLKSLKQHMVTQPDPCGAADKP